MSLNTEKERQSHFFYIVLLLLIAVFGFWQIAFLKYSVTHDMINCWIPWRYYISQCFQNHVFPFWNPYQQLGYPIHADLQGPTWYPESILLSMTTGQANYTLHFLFIFYVFLAGIGMYFLSLCFHTKRGVAFLTAVCYMLGGFFVAHVQHFYAVIGAAWLPFILLNYYKMHAQKSYLHALYAAIFMFFNLTGGNHTFSIILVYLFIAVFCYFVYAAWKEKNTKAIFQYLRYNLLFAGVTLLMASVVLVAFYQTAPYIARLGGMTYKAVSVCPLSPQSLLSFVLPFSTVNSMEFFNTDPSMCNMYTGVIMLVFVLLAAIAKKTAFEKVLFVFALVCLVASFGAYTPLHKLFFNFLPFMNLFRFPSYFSLFSVMIFLVLAGKQLAAFIDQPELYRKKVMITIICLAGVIVICLIVALERNTKPLFFFRNFETIFDFIKAASFEQNIILQGTIQLLFLAALTATLFLAALKDHRMKILCVLIILDLFVSVRLNIAYVGFSPASPKELHDYLATLPQDFPVPADNNIIENTEQLGQQHGLYRNTSGFHKRISEDVFNSYAFKNYAMLKDSMPRLYTAFLTNRLVYFSDRIYANSQVTTLDSTNITPKTIVLSDADYALVKNQLDTGNTDSLLASATVTAFSPNEITIRANASKAQLLTLLQSHYKGWEASIDGQPAPVFVSNYLTMSVVFPPGAHEVKFGYRNPAIVTAGILSYVSFILVLIFISAVWIIKQKNYWAPALTWFVIIGAVVYYFCLS